MNRNTTDLLDSVGSCCHTSQTRQKLDRFPSVANIIIFWESPEAETKSCSVPEADSKVMIPGIRGDEFQKRRSIREPHSEEKVEDENHHDRMGAFSAVIARPTLKRRGSVKLLLNSRMKKVDDGDNSGQPGNSFIESHKTPAREGDSETTISPQKVWRMQRRGSINLLMNSRMKRAEGTEDANSRNAASSSLQGSQGNSQTSKPKAAPKVLKIAGSSRLLQSPSTSDLAFEEKESEERGYTIRFADKSAFEFFPVPKSSPDDFEALFYDEDEIAEFRYEAFCESLEDGGESFLLQQ